jgi:hypothetical protein
MLVELQPHTHLTYSVRNKLCVCLHVSRPLAPQRCASPSDFCCKNWLLLSDTGWGYSLQLVPNAREIGKRLHSGLSQQI